VPGIHVLAARKDVDGRDKPGHDGKRKAKQEGVYVVKGTPFDLTGTVAVITGSSRGIGRSSAELLAKLGAKVVISSRKADACHEVAEGIKKAGGDAHVIPCNISRPDEVKALIGGTTKHYGKVDILVCNAAVNPYYGPLLDIKDEAFDKIMGSNVKSNIWLCAEAIPQMAGRGKGSVVIISSIGGLRGSTVIGAYGISKAADFALCRSLAGEWGPKGVRVNCVAPRRARRDRRRGGVSCVGCLHLHDRPDHRGGWRRDHSGGVALLPRKPAR
jgi:NAD(P)-dependent dehydrogenase (short-subunit alcohol dehydrogenase family)